MSYLEYSILGPLGVREGAAGDQIVLSEKLSLLLARLLLDPGTVVAATTLADDVWDEEVELRDPVNSVQRLVSQLRQRLGDTGEPRRMLVSVGAAYRIDADELTIDAERFRRLARRGHDLVAQNPRTARAMLEEALGCWRGPLLGGHSELRWVKAAAAELETLRNSAEIDLNEVLLPLGDHDRLEGSLRRQLAQHPADERRHAQLIRVLEAMGREAEAGLAYRDAVLALGSPGSELRRLGERIGRRVRAHPPGARFTGDGPRSSCVLLHARIASPTGAAGERALGTAALIADQHGGEPRAVDTCRLVAIFDDAAACARTARALATDPQLDAAVGLHHGGVAQVGGHLLGPGPDRCRLIADAAHPGQVLVSETACECDLGTEDLHDLGEQRYVDVLRGERVFELREPGREASFPAPRTLSQRPHNLPVQQSRFVGRERELTAIARSVTPGELVTLVGAGGCGKTRLSLQLAAQCGEDFEDGAWFASLAEIAPDADVEKVAVTVVARLNARATPNEPARKTLLRHLSDREALLVIDNCEHVVAAARELMAELRADCPRVCVITTSRRPLRVDGERVIEVPAMNVAIASDGRSLPEAVELLLERAGWLPDGSDDADVLDDARRICLALEGSPLGIELAASNVALRGMGGVAVEVMAMLSGERDLDLFASGDPARAPRQRTIEAAIRWSYDLLTAREQAVLRRLAVFRGSFGMAEAQRVAKGGDLTPADVANVVGGLVDCSMVASESPLGGAGRLRLKQAVRAFLFGQLEESGELEHARDAHTDAYRELATLIAPTLFGEREQFGLNLLEADHDNLCAAFGHSVARGRSDDALELVGAMWWLWYAHGHLEEGCDWVRTVLELDDRPSQARVRALRAGSHLEWWRGDYAKTAEYNQELETCARAIGDEWGVAWALMGRGAVLMWSDPESALQLFDESRHHFEKLGRDWEAGYALQLVALGHLYAARERAARSAYQQTMSIFERLGHGSVLASVRRGLGLVSARCGEPERGRALCSEALAFSHSIGDRAGSAQALNFLASICHDEGELETAAERHADALSRARQIGDLWATCSAFDGIAGVACELGEVELAARLLALSDVLARRAGYQRPPHERAQREIQAGLLLSALGSRDLERATAEGELMNLSEAVASARAFVSQLSQAPV